MADTPKEVAAVAVQKQQPAALAKPRRTALEVLTDRYLAVLDQGIASHGHYKVSAFLLQLSYNERMREEKRKALACATLRFASAHVGEYYRDRALSRIVDDPLATVVERYGKQYGYTPLGIEADETIAMMNMYREGTDRMYRVVSPGIKTGIFLAVVVCLKAFGIEPLSNILDFAVFLGMGGLGYYAIKSVDPILGIAGGRIRNRFIAPGQDPEALRFMLPTTPKKAELTAGNEQK